MPDLPEGMLDDVKDYLHITWQDEKTDKKVTGYIKRGMKRLQEIAGTSLSFNEEDSSYSLLLDYCRYANSQALEVFEKNFQSDLIELNFSSQYNSIAKLVVISAAGTVSGDTALTVSPTLTSGSSYMYKTDDTVVLPVLGNICAAEGYKPWDGTAELEANDGDEIVIAEVGSTGAAQKAGKAIVTTKG